MATNITTIMQNSNKIDLKMFAKMLNDREVGYEITKQEETLAEKLGFVVVFGYSDDNMEFRGAIDDEVGCYDGGTVYLNKDGLMQKCECECEYYEKAIKSSKKIKANWCINGEGGWMWTYETDIPHEVFEVYDEKDYFCLGIVFDINNLD